MAAELGPRHHGRASERQFLKTEGQINRQKIFFRSKGYDVSVRDWHNRKRTHLRKRRLYWRYAQAETALVKHEIAVHAMALGENASTTIHSGDPSLRLDDPHSNYTLQKLYGCTMTKLEKKGIELTDAMWLAKFLREDLPRQKTFHRHVDPQPPTTRTYSKPLTGTKKAEKFARQRAKKRENLQEQIKRTQARRHKRMRNGRS